MWTKEKVAATIDHAALKPSMTDADIRSACETGMQYGVATVCVRPCDVALAASALAGSKVRVSAVIGFPHGTSRSETKALEARLALADGASELDMVINVGKLLSGEDDYVREDIAVVVKEAEAAGALVKTIFEVCYLSDEDIVRACRLAEEAGARFVKTSTGFAEGGATPESVAVMVAAVGGRLGVKASGGIRNWNTAVAYLEQGCTRLGAGGTAAILDGAQAAGAY